MGRWRVGWRGGGGLHPGSAHSCKKQWRSACVCSIEQGKACHGQLGHTHLPWSHVSPSRVHHVHRPAVGAPEGRVGGLLPLAPGGNHQRAARLEHPHHLIHVGLRYDEVITSDFAQEQARLGLATKLQPARTFGAHERKLARPATCAHPGAAAHLLVGHVLAALAGPDQVKGVVWELHLQGIHDLRMQRSPGKHGEAHKRPSSRPFRPALGKGTRQPCPRCTVMQSGAACLELDVVEAALRRQFCAALDLVGRQGDACIAEGLVRLKVRHQALVKEEKGMHIGRPRHTGPACSSMSPPAGTGPHAGGAPCTFACGNLAAR